MTNEEKNGYIYGFLETEGIQLDPAEIAVNDCLLKIGKLSLNSLWGKFGENPQLRSTTTVFTEASEFFEHMARPDIEIIAVLPWGEGGAYVNWKSNDFSQSEPLKHGVVPIGAFTTSYGRMCLYHVLNALQSTTNNLNDNVVLYCDTDGIIFIQRPGITYDLPIGDGLGQLSTTLDPIEHGPNAYIIEFVAIGPKAYSYKIFNPDTQTTTEISKCKGIVTSVKNAETLNFKNMEDLVTKRQLVTNFSNNSTIKRKVPFTIVTEPEHKNIKFTYSKRAIVDNNCN